MQGLYAIPNISAEPKCVDQETGKQAAECKVRHWRFRLVRTAWMIPGNESDAGARFGVQAWFCLLSNLLSNGWKHPLLAGCHVSPQGGRPHADPRHGVCTGCCRETGVRSLWSCVGVGNPFCFCELVVVIWVSQNHRSNTKPSNSLTQMQLCSLSLLFALFLLP